MFVFKGYLLHYQREKKIKAKETEASYSYNFHNSMDQWHNLISAFDNC